MTTETKDHNPSVEEVNAFLAKKDAEGVTDLPLKPEELGVGTEETVPAFEPQKDTRFDEDSQTSLLDKLHGQTRPFTKEQLALTAAEKESYLKSVLFDEPVEFTLSLSGSADIKATLRSRNTFESSVIFRTVEQEIAGGAVRDPAVYMTYLQQYSACFQLRRFGGKEVAGVLTYKEPVDMQKAVDELRQAHAKVIQPMNAPRWNIILRLISLFEAKLALAADGLINGDFSGPAS